MPSTRPRSHCRARSLVLLVATLLGAVAAQGCGDSSSSSPSSASDFETAGPFPPGNTTIVLRDAARSRTLTVEVWYPAVPGARRAAEEGEPVEDFFPPGAERAQYAQLLSQSPDPGPSRRTHAARDAVPASTSTPWPILVFSHCFTCTRFSSFSIAERLASHGFVVAAPDHAGDTVFDATLPLTAETLQTRGADVRFVLTALLARDAGAEVLPVDLLGRLDATRAGVFGHSFGSVTTGLVLQDDDRFRAGAGIAAPFENPLLPGVFLAGIAEPVLYLMAREDNSIGEIGNQFMRVNYTAAPSPIWKVEVADAGHWSFSDLCHLGSLFTPGCGDGLRQTVPGEPFRYLPIGTGRAIGAAYVTAFFAAHLRGDPAGLAYLQSARPADVVDVAMRN